MEKPFVIKVEKDGYRHGLKFVGNWWNAYVLQRGETGGITLCGFLAEGEFSNEAADCPKCLEKVGGK